jgi:TonB family protein
VRFLGNNPVFKKSSKPKAFGTSHRKLGQAEFFQFSEAVPGILNMKLTCLPNPIVVLTLLAFVAPALPSLTASPALIEEIETIPNSNAVLPRLTAQVAAVYPEAFARRAGEAVVMSFTVDEDGKVKDPKVLSTPSTQLEGPAKKAVLAWKFQAGARQGRPATFRLKAPVTFSVSGETIDDAPAANRRVAAVYPYEQLVKGQKGWGEVSFVVDHTGRAILAAPTAASDDAFSKSLVAMVEATDFAPAKKGKRVVMASSLDREIFSESMLDPIARSVLTELRKPGSPGIFTASDLDERPRAVAQRSAVYPRSLKTDGLTGQAEIEFIVDRDGRVLFPRILSASHEDFGWSAATAVSQWRFNPPMRNGHRVEVRMTVPVIFDAQKLASSD